MTKSEQVHYPVIDVAAQNTDDPFDLLLVGTQCQAHAWTTTEPVEAQLHFDQSRIAFNKVVQLGDTTDPSVAAAGVVAKYILGTEAISQPLIVAKQMPDLSVVNRVHRATVSSLHKEMASQYNRYTQHAYDTFSVLSLMHFWQVAVHQETGWLAIPSFSYEPLSEVGTTDEALAQGHISVFAWYNDAIEQIYSVEVSTTAEVLSPYLHNDVSVVLLDQDLKISNEPSTSAQTIVDELYSKKTATLKERAAQLIDTIDERTVGSMRA